MATGGYREQYDRMLRWYERLRAAAREGPLDRSIELRRDDVLSFFQNALHVRDWIWYDDEVPEAERNAAWDLVENDPTLARCYHIAIGAKHRTVERPIDDKRAELNTRREIDITLSEGLSEGNEFYLPPGITMHTVTLRFSVQTDAGNEDAEQFAAKCVGSWQQFFAAYRL